MDVAFMIIPFYYWNQKKEITKIPVPDDDKQVDRLKSLERLAAEVLHENDTWQTISTPSIFKRPPE
jgi:hypothetical protein